METSTDSGRCVASTSSDSVGSSTRWVVPGADSPTMFTGMSTVIFSPARTT